MKLIDADALWKKMQTQYTDGSADDEDRYNVGINVGITKCYNLMAGAPTIEPKRGEWIYGEHDVAMCDGYRCDRCGFFIPWDYEHKSIDFINDYHFCPNCGARMKGADDE